MMRQLVGGFSLLVLMAGWIGHAAAQTRVIQSSDCVATAAAPTHTEGQSVPCSEDLSGNVRTTSGTLQAGENATAQALNIIFNSPAGPAIRHTTAGDKTIVMARAAILVKILVTAGTSATATIWDTASGACNTGTQLTGAFPLTAGQIAEIGSLHSNGICVTLAGTGLDVTMVYK